jgi:hypothetical protein
MKLTQFKELVMGQLRKWTEIQNDSFHRMRFSLSNEPLYAYSDECLGAWI